MNDKKAFIKTFFPESVNDIQIVYMNLDQNGLTLCDILRNINKFFPINSSDRFDMIDGKKVVAVICRSDLIEPVNGIILLISHNIEIRTQSKNYILISVDEEDIRDEESLNEINDGITMYLAKLLQGRVLSFEDFYVRHVYNDYEKERYEDDDDEEE